MLMPKANRHQIYEHLFKEGVMAAMKDVHLPKHPEVDVPNLHVIKALVSLKSRGYVTEQFAWRHYYWYLTNEGIQYLREVLHLPPEIVPATLKPKRVEAARARPAAMAREQTKLGDDRSAYRKAGPPGAEGDKKGDVGIGEGAEMGFKGGYGRGRGGAQQE
uniref:Ribosomal protein S10e n=1 Tax=Artemia franciscana TaxID=6661 RepID=B0FWQ7_ARTSF|nr:ribosomal protein S10e [Artemia franciscana]